MLLSILGRLYIMLLSCKRYYILYMMTLWLLSYSLHIVKILCCYPSKVNIIKLQYYSLQSVHLSQHQYKTVIVLLFL